MVKPRMNCPITNCSLWWHIFTLMKVQGAMVTGAVEKRHHLQHASTCVTYVDSCLITWSLHQIQYFICILWLHLSGNYSLSCHYCAFLYLVEQRSSPMLRLSFSLGRLFLCYSGDVFCDIVYKHGTGTNQSVTHNNGGTTQSSVSAVQSTGESKVLTNEFPLILPDKTPDRFTGSHFAANTSFYSHGESQQELHAWLCVL